MVPERGNNAHWLSDALSSSLPTTIDDWSLLIARAMVFRG
jgi:hypothetical protein